MLPVTDTAPVRSPDLCGHFANAGFYKFAGLVPDTYVLEVVKPAVVAGGMYSFQFATPGQGSVVRCRGQPQIHTGIETCHELA